MTRGKKKFSLALEHSVRIVTVLILACLAVLVYVVRTMEQDLATENAELKATLVQMIDIQSSQQELITELATELSVELEGLREETSEQLAAARQTVASTKRELQTAINSQKTRSVTEVVDDWRPRMAFIRCEFNFLGARVAQQGAATLFKVDGEPRLVTNRHVVESPASQLISCYYRFPQDTDNIQFPKAAITYGSSEDAELVEPDYARVVLTEPNTFVTNQMKTLQNSVCTEEPLIGDEVVILGFPTIGSSRDLTATEGIIAAIEDNYYVTSAKVDSGNSGGAAIHIENDCYLGIPTFTALGQAESLARILRADGIVLE